jgi:peroxiredoxin
MIELGELEKRHQDFEQRKARIFVISSDDLKTTQLTQADFRHLSAVSDAEQNVAKAMQVLDPGKGPHGSDTNAPTTFFVDGAGTVRWVFRPERFISRLTPDELLTAMDQHSAK